MSGWSVNQLIGNMGQGYPELFKDRLAQYLPQICPAENRVVYGLLSVLCREDVRTTLSSAAVAEVLDVLFAAELTDERWLLRYLEELYRYIPDRNEKLHLSTRAERYHAYLGKRIEVLKADRAYALNDDAVLTLIDLVVLILVVNRDNETEESSFDIRPDAESVRILLREMLGTLTGEEPAPKPVPAPKPGFAVFGMKIDLPDPGAAFARPKHTLNAEEKRLALVLTWLLYYRGCEQLGISAEEADR